MKTVSRGALLQTFNEMVCRGMFIWIYCRAININVSYYGVLIILCTVYYETLLHEASTNYTESRSLC